MSIVLKGKDPITGQSKLFGRLTEWTEFTPTGSWSTNVSYVGWYREVGDTLEVRIGISLSGVPDAIPLTVQLPPGFTINSNKITNSTLKAPVGQGTTLLTNIATNPTNSSVVITANPGQDLNTVEVYAPEDVGTFPFLSIDDATAVTNVNPDAFGDGDAIELIFAVPI